ncbi:TonB-dependent receptor [Pseudoxanthomonas wuyuanensis]
MPTPTRLHGAICRALIAGGFAVCAVSPAFAQNATPPAANDGAANASPTQLDAVVVTGRAGTGARSKAETSYSITGIDEERLRLQAPTSVTESLKSVPGFWVEASGGEASGNVRARGIPVDGFGSITLLDDGMPVQHDPALGYLNGDQAFRLDETTERIEVVRGGPSSIFYSNAPAGAVNFIPRQPGDTAEGIFKYTVGDYGLYRGDFWLGTPIGQDWKLSLGGYYRQDDGVRDPGFTANDGGQLRLNLVRELEGGSLSFDVKHMDDKVMLYLGVPMRTNEDGEIRAVPGFDGHHGTLAGPETERIGMLMADGSRYGFDNSEGTHVKRDQYTFKFEKDLDGWLLRDSVRYNVTETQRNGMFPNALQSASSFLANPDNLALLAGYPGATALQFRYVTAPDQVYDTANQNGNGLIVIGGLRGVTAPVNELMNDARVSRRFESGTQSHDVSLGYYYAKVDQDFDRYSSTVLLDAQDNARLLDLVAVDADGNPLATISDGGIWRYGYEWENASGSSTTHAVYLSDEWQINDKLRIDGGLRWEKVDMEGWVEGRRQVNLGTAPTSQIWTGTGQFLHYDQGFDKLGWTVGGNWQFDDYSGLFARWTSTFRLPNLGSFITNATAKPIIQTMDLGEVGYKYTHQKFDLYATAFFTQYDNVGYSNYVFDANTGASTQQQLYADTRTLGLELEGTFYPVDWFDVSFTATVQDPQYRGLRFTDSGEVLRDYDGNQLIRVPKNSLRVVPGFNLLGDRLRLQLAYERQGERYVDTANSVRLPSYDVFNFSGRYAFDDQWSLFAYVDNLGNSLGLTEGNPRAGEVASGDAGANTFIARPLLGRAYRLAVMYRF